MAGLVHDGPLPNGGGSTSQGELSAAEALRLKHEAQEALNPTIEDVVDEEDILHPPPSSKKTNETQPVLEPVSANATVKQRAPAAAESGGVRTAQAASSLNTQSHELFPELGASSQSRTPRPVATAWGSKKPATVGTPSNGMSPLPAAPQALNGSSLPSTNASSGASTPLQRTDATEIGQASSARPTHTPQRGPVPQQMSIPGKYSDRITLFPQEMKARSQLKKPVSAVVQEINRKSKANIQVAAGPGGGLRFDATGPVDAVRQALKEVAKELGSKQTTKVSVPASVRPHIIGRQGTVVQAISQRTGAHIQVPRPDEIAASSPDGEDDDAIIDVVIEGDTLAAEMARREIEAIVNERTSSVNVKLREIPAEFYPFIAGPHNSRVAAMEDGKDLRIRVPYSHSWSESPPQPSAANEAPNFLPASHNPILLAGDRLAVQKARAEIENQVQHLRQLITSSQLDISRGQHQFVLGEKGMSLHDFLAETECVVLLPPPSSDTETLTIVGPVDKIEDGVNHVISLATTMHHANVDVSRQHPNAPRGASDHARNLTRYLRQRQEVSRLERLFDAHIALPSDSDGSTAWDIYSREGKNMIRARAEIINIVNGHPPARLSQIDVDSFYHEHLQEQVAQQLERDHGVYLVLPEPSEESSQVLLVYEGPRSKDAAYELPKKHPSPAEISEFERRLQSAKDLVQSIIREQKEVVGTSIQVPKKYHEKVQRFVNRQQQSGTPAGGIPVKVQVGEPKGQGRAFAAQQTPISAAALENEVSLRGPEDDVNTLAEKILQFVAEEKEYERERGFTLTFDFPQKYANFLIGKKGENVKRYREEFDVDIKVNDGKVEIKGPKTKAEAAKAKIVSLGKKLEDEATHVLKIKAQYHRDLIGPKGGQVNRLQDRYNVRVNFPRSPQANSTNDNQSVTDAGSDVGASPRGNNRPTQAPDEVIIRGPRKGADAARDELLSLLQWTIDNSHSDTVSVAQSQIPMLIGQGGREMDDLRMTTGAHVDVPHPRDGVSSSGRVEIRIKGTKKQVEDAKKRLEQRAKIFDETVVRKLDVDRSHHRALIGPGGSVIREIVVNAGGSDDKRDISRTVRFPPQASDDTVISVEGHKAVVDKIVTAIEEIVKKREDQVTESIDVAPEKHRLLIGRGGETRKRLCSQFNVNIDVPKQGQTGESASRVKITGIPSDVAQAKEQIMSMVKDREGQTIQVPRRVHHIVSDNGSFFRRLRDDLDVRVDHAGQSPPSKPSSSTSPKRQPNGRPLPLITDEVTDGAGANSEIIWELHALDAGDGEATADDSAIPWVLHGSAPGVAKARAKLEAALEQALQQSHAGYLGLPDPRAYRYIIGPGGSQVNAIREQTGCKITVPRNGQGSGEAIEILGSEKGVEEARKIIIGLSTRE
ncbi:MAG: hypothetical protein M1825_000579 [Sarcosagium campestre]|nr:MAG: hypothetical protein M1825_000579 [Sarcosagium campestre]